MADEIRAGHSSKRPERGWERRLTAERRKVQRRQRAVLVENDRRSGRDRRSDDRRKR